MKKRLVKVFAGILAGLSVMLAACSVVPQAGVDPAGGTGGQESGDKAVTLKLWHIWATDSDSNRRPFEKALAQWNEEHPEITIQQEATENETYKIKIRTAMAANEAPDIFYSWGAGFARPFVEAGKVLALDDYLNGEVREKLLPGSLDNFTYNDSVYGLPIYLIAGVFYLNRELFENNGIKMPDTYEELLQTVAAFREKNIIPMTVGEKDGWPGIFYQNILAIRTAGVKTCNDALNKRSSFDAPGFVDSAEKLMGLIRAGAFDSRSLQLTRDEAEQDFINGRVAMYYNGSWFAGSLDREDCPVKGKIEVRNFPVVEGAKGDANGFLGGAIDTFMISASTPYKDEAVDALFAITESFCRESYLEGAGIPAWKVSVDEAQVSPLLVDMLDLLEESDGFVLAWDTFLAGTEAQIHMDLVEDLFAERRTPEDFAKEMQKMNEGLTGESGNGNWKLVWQDEFDGENGSLPDPEKWVMEIGNNNGWGNQELQYYTSEPANCRQEDGMLIIEALKEEREGFDYTSARIKTQGLFDFQYGKVEMRARLPYGQGIWPAFWMLGSSIKEVGWPQCGEIDIMEFIGRVPDKIFGTLHGPEYSGGRGLQNSVQNIADLKEGFHTYGIEWDKDAIRWYFDGTLYHQVIRENLPTTYTWVYDDKFFILLNLAVGGLWPEYPDDTTVLPQRYVIDYVRVYQ